MNPPQSLLRQVFDAAVAAANPLDRLPAYLPPVPPRGRTVVVGAGKAAAAMARAVEDHWEGPLSGLVVTRYGHGLPSTWITVVEAGHPVPDAAGQAAAQSILNLVTGLTADDLVICLISGGGSSLLALPAPGISLADKQAIGRRLLTSGATISEFNCVRKHLSAIKGGRLAALAAPARVVTFLISDVPGDDPSVIASGPTVPDPTTCADALEVLAKYAVPIPTPVLAHLQNPASETPKPGAPCFRDQKVHLIATPQQSLEAAAETAQKLGVPAVILGDAIEGEARELARTHADLARRVANRTSAGPCLLLSGGETSVTVRGQGRGGRNAEYLLGLAVALEGNPHIHALACDTDGIDGVEDNAGALLAPDTLARARARGLDASASLADNDAYSFFQALDDLVITGPTRTNVNDFRAILIDRRT